MTPVSLIVLPLKKLRRLILANAPITDKGVALLCKLDKLEELGLLRTKITAACLPHIRELKTLASLDVRETAIKKSDVKELRRAMPKLEIFVEHSIIQGDSERTQEERPGKGPGAPVVVHRGQKRARKRHQGRKGKKG